MLLGVGGTIYNNYTLEPFQELGPDSQRVKKLASDPSFIFILSFTLPNLTRRALSSTIIILIKIEDGSRSSLQPCLLIPIDLFLFLLVEEFYGTRYQSGSFSLMWGVNSTTA